MQLDETNEPTEWDCAQGNATDSTELNKQVPPEVPPSVQEVQAKMRGKTADPRVTSDMVPPQAPEFIIPVPFTLSDDQEPTRSPADEGMLNPRSDPSFPAPR